MDDSLSAEGSRINETHRPSPLLIGMTGGIATGKTTVANMLAEHGAHVIDFDILAREVVEPDKPAWRDIIDHFGEDILNKDRTINRKKLSGVVFSSSSERKILERFTHQRIQDAFLNQLDAIVSSEPDAVVLAVIPLLIEVGMQQLFHKILVVYTPREVQIERLIQRDGLDEQAAVQILDSQMPIDEKLKYADFVIDNRGEPEQTRSSVDKLWQDIDRLRKGRQP